MNKLQTLKPISYKKAYDDIIARQISDWIYDNFFYECFKILKDKTVINSINDVIGAIKSGLIYYQDGAFYSTRATFSNNVAKELEKIGAEYSKHRKAYVIGLNKLDVNIIWAIQSTKAVTFNKAVAIQAFLAKQLGRLDDIQKELLINKTVEKIMLDLQERVYKNAAAKKIELITPKLTDFRANEIANNYTNNLEFWIKNWAEEDIPEMREVVGQMAIDGKSVKSIQDYLEREWGINKRKAKFLARNESAIATTSYLSAKYREEGFTKFQWHTILDGRERKLHKKLNGKIFSFDNPPIIDERTGAKGLPAETYNCRCTLSPVIDKEFIENRRKIFEEQKSIKNKIKKVIQNARDNFKQSKLSYQ